MNSTAPKPVRALDRAAAALESVGLMVVIPGQPVLDANDLATRVRVAAATLSAARREELQRQDDDDFGLDADPGEVWHG